MVSFNVNPAMTDSDNKRFIILGTGGHFTYCVIQQLLFRKFHPVAYIQATKMTVHTDRTFAGILLENTSAIPSLAQRLKHNQVPAFTASEIDLPDFIKEQHIAYLLVACWPRILPETITGSVSKAALNLHPSLLPDFRGFDPINDQLKTADRNFGISLHLLSDQLDSGDIVFQRSFYKDKAPNKKQIESEAAEMGADLFIDAVNSFDYPGWKVSTQT